MGTNLLFSDTDSSPCRFRVRAPKTLRQDGRHGLFGRVPAILDYRENGPHYPRGSYGIAQYRPRALAADCHRERVVVGAVAEGPSDLANPIGGQLLLLSKLRDRRV